MRANPQFLKDKFKEYNQLYFKGELPEIRIKVFTSRRTIGMFVHPRHRVGNFSIDLDSCEIKISNRMDLPTDVLEDTLIHEMIHYYIWYKRIPDNAKHGNSFINIMREINRTGGRHITVKHKSTTEQLESDYRYRDQYICVTKWMDGTEAITVCARTKIFAIHNAFRRSRRVIEIQWYWSNNPWFNQYPSSRTAKAYLMTSETEERLMTALPCECDGKIFQPVRL